MEKEKVNILMVDDHTVFRSGLRLLLEIKGGFTVVGEAGSGEQAIELARELSPDIILMDLAMPGMDGLTTMLRIQEIDPKIKILVITQHADRAYLLPALQAGASGYILKSSKSDDLLAAIHMVKEGKIFIDPSVAGTVMEDYRQKTNPQASDSVDMLSEREKEVLRLCALGHTSREIAEQLVINTKTVDTHKGRLRAKLGIKTRAELVNYAFENGILPKPG
jgi:two-component system, NarL family, response regulator NreC